jgi:glucose/arabinose dehydrogenase
MSKLFALLLLGPLACSAKQSADSGTSSGSGVGSRVSGSILHPCNLPGSLQRTANGVTTVRGGHTAGGGALPDVGYVNVPVGFCVHYFGNVGNARQIRFAPSGEAFVASPTAPTTSAGSYGQSAIVVLPDDDDDGVADPSIEFLGDLPATQGLLFAGGYLYYQDSAKIMRVPYTRGDRAPSGASQVFADIGAIFPPDPVHWPKTLDVADDGTIYVGNGGSNDDPCVAPPWPFLGGIVELDGSGNVSPVVRGLRNPIAVRCSQGHDQCFALELVKDATASEGGREKLLPIRAGDDWGYPCCATKNLAYVDNGAPTPPDCSGVSADTDSFFVGDTPFGLDFEPGAWPGMWGGRVYIAMHGAAGTWTGARLVGIEMDSATGLPLPGANYSVETSDTGGMSDFATGWDNVNQTHGRPTAVAFSADGRLFLTNDTNGDIVWIAPNDL